MLGLSDRDLSRFVSALSCAYLLWVFAVLWRHTRLFVSYVSALGADTPASTGLVFDNYTWLYPLLFLVIVAILVGKEFFISNEQARLAVTLIVSLLAIFVVDFLKSLLFLPLLNLIDQLN